MNGAGRVWMLFALAAASAAASAQRIEISSDSIGTVVVTPPATGSASHTATSTVNGDPRRTGVDLGVQRRPDGTLYDPLDPNQNPAAVPASSQASDTAPTPATANRGSGSAR